MAPVGTRAFCVASSNEEMRMQLTKRGNIFGRCPKWPSIH